MIFKKGSKKAIRSNLEKKLSEFEIGERGIVKMVNGEGRIRRRLFDMGITPGTEIYLRKKTPLGDPMEVMLRGYELTLRKNEAETVEMEMIR
ncbi:MAG: ferrous iron transport protein A [Clostridia bacterium]|nr:ferrous iron transport protein A [Clostridia bacterium]